MATTETTIKFATLFSDGNTRVTTLPNANPDIVTVSNLKTNVAIVNAHAADIGNSFLSDNGGTFNKITQVTLTNTITTPIYDSQTYNP